MFCAMSFRNAPERRLALVADHETLGGVGADVEDDLTILDEIAGHHRVSIDGHRDVGRQTLIGTPFIDGTDQIRLVEISSVMVELSSQLNLTSLDLTGGRGNYEDTARWRRNGHQG